MSIVSFNILKINASRNRPTGGKMSISNNIKLSNLEEAEMNLPEGRKSLRVTYEYLTTYKPDLAEILIKGEAYLILNADDAKVHMDYWEKNKDLPTEGKVEILNTILQKMTVEAIRLSDQLQLPPPIPLPTYKKKD